MKLDKIKFASLIDFISCRYALTITQDDMREIDELITIDVENEKIYPSSSDISQLMFLMQQGTQKIEAIKLCRKLTGWSLKDSKDEVEKYWPQKLSKKAIAAKLIACYTCSEDKAYDVAEQLSEMI